MDLKDSTGYESERLKQAIDKLKPCCGLISIGYLFRSTVFAILGKDFTASFLFRKLIISSIIGVVLAYLAPPLLRWTFNRFSLQTNKYIHFMVCIMLCIVEVTLPISTAISSIVEDYDRGFTIAPFLAVALYLATNVCRTRILSIICLLNCYATFYFLVPKNATSDIEYIMKICVSSFFAILLTQSFEQERKLNFMLRKTVERKEELYRRFINALPCKVVMYSPDHGIRFQNDYRIPGYPTLENSTHEFMDFCRKLKDFRNNSHLESKLIDIMNSAGSLRNDAKPTEYSFQDSNIDKTYTLNVSIFGPGMFDDSITVGIIFENITEKRLIEEEINARKYANALLCSLSHELKTPLNTVIGTIEQLHDNLRISSASPEDLTKLALLGKNSALLLNHTINDYLDFVKYQAGQLKLTVDNVNVKNFVESIYQLCSSVLTHEIDFSHYIDRTVPEVIKIDKARVSQIIINLVLNAIKYTKHGHVQLRVYTTHKPLNEKKIKFEVKDTGIGIPPERASSLFKLSTRGSLNLEENDDSEHGSGLSGLGLTISQILCNSMGSKIKVKSKVNVGTTFWFNMNFKQVAHIPASAHLEAKYEAFESIPNEDSARSINYGSYHYSCIKKKPNEKPLVIIVDDVDMNRFVLKKIIQQNYPDVEIFESQNGADAITSFIDNCLIKTGKALILMDIEMPIMDGIKATKRIRAFKCGVRPKIVAVTAYDTPKEMEKCFEAGFDEFCVKPVQSKIIIRLMEELVNKSKAEES